MTTFGDLFTDRQLVALTTFSDLVQEARPRVEHDALAAGLDAPRAAAYADAVATYLAFAVDKAADYWSTICSWHSGRDTIRNTFARQAIPMIWDFSEANPLSSATGNILGSVDWVARAVQSLPTRPAGTAVQADAAAVAPANVPLLISTDPPYYDNIGYADLSDYFYVWLRRMLGRVYPKLLSTLLVPKAQELVATPLSV